MGTLTATPSEITSFPDDTQPDKLPTWALVVTSDPPTDNIAASYESDGGWLTGDPTFDSGIAGIVRSTAQLGQRDPSAGGIRATCLRGRIRLTALGFDPLIVLVTLMV